MKRSSRATTTGCIISCTWQKEIYVRFVVCLRSYLINGLEHSRARNFDYNVIAEIFFMCEAIWSEWDSERRKIRIFDYKLKAKYDMHSRKNTTKNRLDKGFTASAESKTTDNIEKNRTKRTAADIDTLLSFATNQKMDVNPSTCSKRDSPVRDIVLRIKHLQQKRTQTSGSIRWNAKHKNNWIW